MVAASAAVHAFHVGRDFDKPPGAGGGGGLFYTGSPPDKGWTCTACHTDAPGVVRVEIEVEPPLLDAFRYDPATPYRFTLRLAGESRGLDDPLSNFNTVSLAFVDAAGDPAGEISGYSAEDYWAGTPATIASSGRANDELWAFTWTPPAAGPVTLYVAAVDGDGGGRLDGTGGDPFGDDVLVGSVRLQPEDPLASSRPVGAPAHAQFAAVAGLAVAAAHRRRGRRRRLEDSPRTT
jgi:hypothetical protein